ncbi:protein MFI isoform X2 [Amphiprion ocellaris]|uniref:protein MFI isoform X2 n=1 Tax=Amphiprion ocellaris TaxID=80972 RepID=UPI00241133AC|nr:protein MFI isoform X2 [Amphiprion ocellaris]
MSLQQDEPLEPQQDTMQLVAARIIQRAWRTYVCRHVFTYLKGLISEYNQQDPQTVLRSVNPREITFPPHIYYKIFTYRPITDLCASSPRDYSKLEMKKLGALQTSSSGPPTQEDRSGWYQRVENNTWRQFCSKMVCVDKNTEIGAQKKMDFHYSKLQRKKDVEKWKKRRKIEWLKKMYQQGRMEEQNSVLEVMNNIDEIDDDEILDWEVDELLAWTDTLSFDDYFEDWYQLPCSHSCELSQDVPSYPLQIDPFLLSDEKS